MSHDHSNAQRIYRRFFEMLQEEAGQPIADVITAISFCAASTIVMNTRDHIEGMKDFAHLLASHCLQVMEQQQQPKKPHMTVVK